MDDKVIAFIEWTQAQDEWTYIPINKWYAMDREIEINGSGEVTTSELFQYWEQNIWNK